MTYTVRPLGASAWRTGLLTLEDAQDAQREARAAGLARVVIVDDATGDVTGAGPGRPPTGRGRDGARLEVRLTTAERAEVDAAAQVAGVTASEYARRAVLERVAR